MIDGAGSFARQLGPSYNDPAFIADLREVIFYDTPAGSGGPGNLQRREIAPIRSAICSTCAISD